MSAEHLRRRLASVTDFEEFRRLTVELEHAELEEEGPWTPSPDARPPVPFPKRRVIEPEVIDPSRDFSPAERAERGWR